MKIPLFIITSIFAIAIICGVIGYSVGVGKTQSDALKAGAAVFVVVDQDYPVKVEFQWRTNRIRETITNTITITNTVWVIGNK